MAAKDYLSRPKKAVLDAIEAIQGPFTALQLWRHTELQRSGISRATVYRTLQKLREEGFLKDIILPHGLHVSVRTTEEAYCIVECEDCGHFSMCQQFASSLMAGKSPASMDISHAAIYLRGRCQSRRTTGNCTFQQEGKISPPKTRTHGIPL